MPSLPSPLPVAPLTHSYSAAAYGCSGHCSGDQEGGHTHAHMPPTHIEKKEIFKHLRCQHSTGPHLHSTLQVLPIAWRQLWQWNSTQDDTTIAMAAEVAILCQKPTLSPTFTNFSGPLPLPSPSLLPLQSSYHLLQLLAFTLLAVLVMRLKLFFTPYLCLFMGWAASAKVGGPMTVVVVPDTLMLCV